VIKLRQLTSFTADSRANRFRALGNEKIKTTTGISGRNFRGWSPKLDLLGFWLKTYLELCPLPGTTFARIWSEKVTQSGFFVMKLRLSERGIGERESFLWRTPKADDPNHGSVSCEAVQKKLGKKQTIRLQDQVNHPVLFRTPDAGCARGTQSEKRFSESQKKHRPLSLNDQVAHLLPEQIHLFPTPRAADGMKGQRTKKGAEKEVSRGHGMDLPTFTQLYPTPTVRGNDNRKGSSAHSGDGLSTFVKQMFPTPTVNDSKNNNPPSQRTENGHHSNPLNALAGGSLNPDWVEWLMGFPCGWTEPGGIANPAFPESRKGESLTACRG
jgi:hypothetical protein